MANNNVQYLKLHIAVGHVQEEQIMGQIRGMEAYKEQRFTFYVTCLPRIWSYRNSDRYTLEHHFFWKSKLELG